MIFLKIVYFFNYYFVTLLRFLMFLIPKTTIKVESGKKCV